MQQKIIIWLSSLLGLGCGVGTHFFLNWNDITESYEEERYIEDTNNITLSDITIETSNPQPPEMTLHDQKCTISKNIKIPKLKNTTYYLCSDSTVTNPVPSTTSEEDFVKNETFTVSTKPKNLTSTQWMYKTTNPQKTAFYWMKHLSTDTEPIPKQSFFIIHYSGGTTALPKDDTAIKNMILNLENIRTKEKKAETLTT